MAAPKKSATGTKKTKASKPRSAASGSVRTGKAPRDVAGTKRGLGAEGAAELDRTSRELVAKAVREHANALPGLEHYSPAQLEELAQTAAKVGAFKVLSTEQLRAELHTEFLCAWVHREQLTLGRIPAPDGSELFLVHVLPPRTGSARAMLGPWTASRLFHADKNQPEVIARWVRPLMEDGPAAVLDTLAELIGTADPADLETNTLSWLGNRVSYHLRRAVLLNELVAAKWSLTVAAQRLRLSGASNVARLIHELDLRDAQKEAQRRGLGRAGGPRAPRK